MTFSSDTWTGATNSNGATTTGSSLIVVDVFFFFLVDFSSCWFVVTIVVVVAEVDVGVAEIFGSIVLSCSIDSVRCRFAAFSLTTDVETFVVGSTGKTEVVVKLIESCSVFLCNLYFVKGVKLKRKENDFFFFLFFFLLPSSYVNRSLSRRIWLELNGNNWHWSSSMRNVCWSFKSILFVNNVNWGFK